MSELGLGSSFAPYKHARTVRMALYAAIGAEFKSSILSELSTMLDDRIRSVINRTLKQVAHDYDLDYKVLKAKYCSKESLGEYELPGQTQLVTVDLEPEQEPEITPEPEPAPAPKKVVTKAPEVKAKAPKAKASVAVMALSKMKKGDLVRECEERGLDSEGTVSQLKERVKEARDKEEPVPKDKKEKKKAPAPSKEKAPAKKKEKVKEVAPAPPPPSPVALEEEEGDEDICPRAEEAEGEEEDEEEWEEADTGASLQDRLRKILAEAGEEEEYEDEEED